ncbi:MAG: FG-GAP repeat protein [Solirubrobacteraceae bacterium]
MSTQDEGATMTAWISRLQPSPDLVVASRSTGTPGAVVSRRALVAIALTCLTLGLMLHQGLGGVSRPAGDGVGARAASPAGLLSLPAAAQGSVSAALGRDQAAYRIEGLAAHNPAQRLSARFERSGVAITAGSTQFAISLKAFGRGSALPALSPVSPAASSDRVSYAHGSLREWWTNGPLGLEQGFDLARRPAGAGALTLSLAVPASAHLAHGTLLLPGGLRYAGVHATDAGGRTLPAWLEMSNGRVLLRVNDRGAHYPVRVDPFVQQAELTASDGAVEDDFGYSVAISGDTLVVGAPHQRYPQVESPGADPNPGAAYVFVKGAGGWVQTAKLTAPDGAASGLGWSVAISGNTIVVGAPGVSSVSQPCDGKPPADPGAAYVYSMPAGGWANMTPTAALTAGDACPGDGLGWSVSISGNTVVAGAPWAPTVADEKEPGYPPIPGQGAAYEYTMPSSGWKSMTQTAELLASDSSGEDVHFGWSVGVSGNTIVVGDPLQHGQAGETYVFAMGASGWANMTQTAALTASDPKPGSDQLGTSVAVSGNTVVAGALVHTVGSVFEAGAAYVYVMPASGWTSMTQTAELSSSDASEGEYFGMSVGISEGTVVVGAPQHQTGQFSDSGAAYVYTEPSGGWTNMTQTAELNASDPSTRDSLGTSVAVSGNTILAGAQLHAVGSNLRQGAAYVFGPGSEGAPGGGGNTGGGTTGGGTSTGGGGTSTGPVLTPSVHVVSVSGGRDKLTVTLSCPAGGASCAPVSLQATVTEHLEGSKITAITAGGKKKKAHATTKQVVVASGAVTLPAGTTKVLTLTLNSTGQALLSKFGKLTAIVTVSSGGKAIDTVTVTVRKTKPKRKKK